MKSCENRKDKYKECCRNDSYGPFDICIECWDEWEERNPPKTNADRIRAMSDEELAQALMKALTIGCPPVECGGWKTSCEQCWSYWLKQPAERGE